MAGEPGFMDAVFAIVRESYRQHLMRAAPACSVAVVEETATEASFRVTAEITKRFGGSSEYVPKEGTYVKAGILRDFTGDNHKTLAKQYGLTVDSIYRIVREDQKKRAGKQQARLPGM